MSRQLAEWEQIERLATAGPEAPRFSDEALLGSPEPVRRYFTAAIAQGTPLVSAARLEMRGHIKIGRWLPFHACQILAPRFGTVWRATVAGLIRGSDRYVDGAAGMDWKILGVIPLIHTAGADVARSTAGRAAGESIWVPTAVVPPAAEWTALDDHRIRCVINIGGHPVALEHRIDDQGMVMSSHFDRWGDPDNTGTWQLRPFGVEVTQHQTFGPLAIPSRGRAGWHYGTDRWPEGQFFRFEITSCELIT